MSNENDVFIVPLRTIQKESKLNTVYVQRYSEENISGAYHTYTVKSNTSNKTVGTIKFQLGPRSKASSREGILDVDLLEIVRDRLKGFQSGEFASDYNQKALDHIEEALFWLNQRVEDRVVREC